MNTLAKHRIRVRYEGGDADEGLLPLYDGATSLYGFAQSLCIVTHAYMNYDVVSRATALKGAKIYISPPKRGSFVVEFLILMEANPAITGVAGGLLAAPFYDFVKFTVGKAVGLLDMDPETKIVDQAYKRDEPFFDDLAATLEGSLQRAHRPLGGQERVAYLERPRSKLLELNQNTKDWVETRDTNPISQDYKASVTQFNSITKNGRAFIPAYNRVVPFKPSGAFPEANLRHLTWSLHGSNTNRLHLLNFEAKPVISASGKVKRLVLSNAVRPPP